jgi:hypothetical protein
MTRQGVEALLDRVNARELVKLSKKVEHSKVTNHHRHEYIISESLAAWEKSKEPQKRASRKTSGLGDGDGDGVVGEEVTSTDVIERCGDTTYLRTAMESMSQQADLWGLKVLPASQERASSISSLAEDMKKRGAEYEARQATEDTGGNPDGTPPATPDGTPAV